MLKYLLIVCIMIKCVTSGISDPHLEFYECYHQCRLMSGYNFDFCTQYCGSTLPDSDSESDADFETCPIM